jgi:hypothetical protein
MHPADTVALERARQIGYTGDRRTAGLDLRCL